MRTVAQVSQNYIIQYIHVNYSHLLVPCYGDQCIARVLYTLRIKALLEPSTVVQGKGNSHQLVSHLQWFSKGYSPLLVEPSTGV